MKVLILGAGVVGVSTAYILASRGHEVEVIDRAPEAGAEASFANGGQLSFSHAEPWATPKVLKKSLGWMLKKDAPLVFKWMPDGHVTPWMLKFIAQCTDMRSHANSINLLRLGIYSKSIMEKIRTVSGVEFDNLRNGILHIYTCEKDFAGAVEQAEFQNQAAGATHSMEVLSGSEAILKEPALQYTKANIIGGVFCPIDETGNTCKFTQNLAEIAAQEFGVEFNYNTTIEAIGDREWTHQRRDHQSRRQKGRCLYHGTWVP